MPKLTLKGLASGKTIFVNVITENESKMSLLQYLESQNIPIASSCMGKGECLKCITSQGVATCQITVKEFMEFHNLTILVDYL